VLLDDDTKSFADYGVKNWSLVIVKEKSNFNLTVKLSIGKTFKYQFLPSDGTLNLTW
jgi:hypothetical protein